MNVYRNISAAFWILNDNKNAVDYKDVFTLNNVLHKCSFSICLFGFRFSDVESTDDILLF